MLVNDTSLKNIIFTLTKGFSSSAKSSITADSWDQKKC